MSVVVDLDNTIVDTAVRKRAILFARFGLRVSLDEVRRDYHLESVFRDKASAQYKQFVALLDAPEGVSEFKAPAFQGAVEALLEFADSGLHLYILTARPATLEVATEVELEDLGLPRGSYSLILANPNDYALRASTHFKRRELANVSAGSKIIAVIGDRRSDLDAAASLPVPTIAFKAYEPEAMEFDNPAGHVACREWSHVRDVVRSRVEGAARIDGLRQNFIDQYANWLRDLDAKARMTLAVAAALLALVVAVFAHFASIEGTLSLWLEGSRVLVVFAGMLVLVSLHPSLLAMTSRHTSGPRTLSKIVSEDAERAWGELRSRGDVDQKHAHLEFFIRKYGTVDSEALLNLRLYQLGAINNRKARYEGLATVFLLGGVWCLGFATLFAFVDYLSRG